MNKNERIKTILITVAATLGVELAIVIILSLAGMVTVGDDHITIGNSGGEVVSISDVKTEDTGSTTTTTTTTEEEETTTTEETVSTTKKKKKTTRATTKTTAATTTTTAANNDNDGDWIDGWY